MSTGSRALPARCDPDLTEPFEYLARKGDPILRSAPIAEVRSRSGHATLTPALQVIDVVALTRTR